jgi:hypothetical protein
LIGTSAAFAVGFVITGIGASKCKPSLSQAVECTEAGDALIPLGATILALSGIAMITTGIMLGIRSKQRRDIEREIRRCYRSRRLHWDEKSGRIVF